MQKIFLAAVLLTVSSGSAHAGSDNVCMFLEKATDEGNTSFKNWRGEYDAERRDYRSTTVFPGASRCDIDINDASSPEFDCEWEYDSYEDGAPKQAELSDEIRSCLRDNNPVETASDGIVRRSGKRVSRLHLNVGYLQPKFTIKRQEFSGGNASVFLKIEPELQAEEESKGR